MRKKLGILSVAILSLLLFSSHASATALPWLDFTGNSAWDGTTLTDSFEWTTFVTNRDGSISISDPVVGSFVDFSFSYDGNNTNDFFNIGNWFTADVLITDTSVDPTGLGTTAILLDNLSWTCAACTSSQWYNEFSPQIGVNPYDGQVNLAFLGASFDNTIINVSGKLAPVPEPATLLLLGSGFVGMSFFRRRKKNK